MNRKKFLYISSIGTIGLIAGVGGYVSGFGDNRNDLMKAETLSKILNEDIIKEIGLEYLHRYPNENSVDILQQLLLTDNNLNDLSNVFIYDLMKEKIKLDFEQQNIVILNGWLISVTEARQCALYNLK